MTGEELLFQKNNIPGPKHFDIKNGGIYYKNNAYIFNGDKIKEIIGFIRSAHIKYNAIGIPIILDLGNIVFEDKLTYIILECICNFAMSKLGRKIIISCSVKKSIWTEGIQSSVLPILSTGKPGSFEKFQNKFMHEIYERHYRRIVLADEWRDKYLNSKIMEQIDWFLKNLLVDKEYRDAMAEVISELVGNVHDHTTGDCLIDIDVTTDYNKENADGKYYGLNLVVINFSDNLFGQEIKKKIEDGDIQNERYEIVKCALQNHKILFDGHSYTEEDFYNITAFQHKISGRKNYTNGGTGLTKLIYSLEERSDTHKCYMISGNRSVIFRQELLNYSSDKWIGFNEINDYLNNKPDDGVIAESYIYIPGTAYNLNFAIRKEVESSGI